jgi:outer membrane lipoprotein-sorting protein
MVKQDVLGRCAGRRAIIAVLLLGAAAGLPFGARAQAPTEGEADALAAQILEKADQIRFPSESFEVEVAVTSFSDGKQTDERLYKVLSRGNANTIVQTLEPASERGQAMLMRGRDLWIFIPTVSQPVRLSLSQRLTGQVANGDIARANFSGDYTPSILRTEVIDGQEHYVLELKAVDRSVTYNRVLYWVRKSNFHPHKAEFYSVSGRLLKTSRYENFKNLGGRVRPTRLVLRDALREGEESVMEYSGMKLRDLPARMFSKDYLQRL